MKNISGIAALAIVGLFTAMTPAAHAQCPQPAANKEKKVKDQQEYDLFNQVLKETDNTKKIALIEQWKQKYPDSDYKKDRLLYQLQANQAKQDPKGILSTAKEILTVDPCDLNAQYWIALMTLTSTTPDQLADGEKAANSLLNATKPAEVKDEDWAKTKKDLDTVAHKVLGWVNMQRKSNDPAIAEFTKALELNPNDSQINAWIGAMIVAQKKPELYPLAIFHYARAATYEGTGALNAPGRQASEKYLQTIYKAYHGDMNGLDQVKAMAKTTAIAPADIATKIRSVKEIEEEKQKVEAAAAAADPQGTLWKTLKQALTAANGEEYFNSSMKDAKFPGGVNNIQMFKGTVISGTAKELVVGVSSPSTADVTLKLEKPLKGKPVIGQVVAFEGVAKGFQKEPFMVTFEDANVTAAEGGAVKTEAPARPPMKKGGGAKKGGATKKKG